jgi:hypothetical protein
VQSIRGRYIWERSVSIPWRSITPSNTNRKKVLQITTFMALRAMRSVFCGIYLGRCYSLSQSPYRPRILKATLNDVMAKGRGPIAWMRTQHGATSPQNGSWARFDPRWYKDRWSASKMRRRRNMTEQATCPLCQHENPPENRFCGSCGAPLKSGEQLATRQEHSPVQAGRAWPAKLGPVSKALAVCPGYNAGSGQKSGPRCLPSVTPTPPRAVISSARAWKRFSSGHGRIHVAGLSPAERFDRLLARD